MQNIIYVLNIQLLNKHNLHKKLLPKLNFSIYKNKIYNQANMN